MSAKFEYKKHELILIMHLSFILYSIDFPRRLLSCLFYLFTL